MRTWATGNLAARVCSKTSGWPVVVGDAYKKFIVKQVEKARNYKPRPFVANASIIQAAMTKSTDPAITEFPTAPHTDRTRPRSRASRRPCSSTTGRRCTRARRRRRSSTASSGRATTRRSHPSPRTPTTETRVFSPTGPGPRRAPARPTRPRWKWPWRRG